MKKFAHIATILVFTGAAVKTAFIVGDSYVALQGQLVPSRISVEIEKKDEEKGGTVHISDLKEEEKKDVWNRNDTWGMKGDDGGDGGDDGKDDWKKGDDGDDGDKDDWEKKDEEKKNDVKEEEKKEEEKKDEEKKEEVEKKDEDKKDDDKEKERLAILKEISDIKGNVPVEHLGDLLDNKEKADHPAVDDKKDEEKRDKKKEEEQLSDKKEEEKKEEEKKDEEKKEEVEKKDGKKEEKKEWNDWNDKKEDGKWEDSTSSAVPDPERKSISNEEMKRRKEEQERLADKQDSILRKLLEEKEERDAKFDEWPNTSTKEEVEEKVEELLEKISEADKFSGCFTNDGVFTFNKNKCADDQKKFFTPILTERTDEWEKHDEEGKDVEGDKEEKEERVEEEKDEEGKVKIAAVPVIEKLSASEEKKIEERLEKKFKAEKNKEDQQRILQQMDTAVTRLKRIEKQEIFKEDWQSYVERSVSWLEKQQDTFSNRAPTPNETKILSEKTREILENVATLAKRAQEEKAEVATVEERPDISNIMMRTQGILQQSSTAMKRLIQEDVDIAPEAIAALKEATETFVDVRVECTKDPDACGNLQDVFSELSIVRKAIENGADEVDEEVKEEIEALFQ